MTTTTPSAAVRTVQAALNHFTTTHLHKIPPIQEDGTPGPATDARIRLVKFYLGYAGGTAQQNTVTDQAFSERIWHPGDARYSTQERVDRGAQRRAQQRKDADANHAAASGVTTYDNVHVAAWFVPYMDWARHTGHGGEKWEGHLVSGWRDPAYSESLCRQICGAPKCPGTCAGRSSNHSGKDKPAGAIDVTDYARFGRLMAHCPLEPKLRNDLPIDPVHYSATGH
jgi:hypothetical protein